MVYSLSLFLYLYFAFVFVWLVFSLACVYHMMKFGMANFATYLATFTYIAVSFIIFSTTYYYTGQIDWSINSSIPSGVFSF